VGEERSAPADETGQWPVSSDERPSTREGRRTSPLEQLPLAIVAKVGNALRLVAVDESARHLGLAPGTPLADARAMIPHLAVADDDPAADAALLETIADWAERYTPLVASSGQQDAAAGQTGNSQEARRSEGPTGILLLDITGCAHLFGGEEALRADLLTRLSAQGFLARAAIADTPGAAFAAACFGHGSVIASDDTLATLSPLPLAALRLDPDIVSAMDRVGLKRIGQILAAPRAPLAARFGRELLRRLDQAVGRDEEAIDPRRPPPAFIAERRFAEPIAREEDIAAALSSLAASLAGSLERHGEGARRLEYTLFRVDGVVTRITVGAARPLREPKLILALFREKFAALGDELDAGFGFDMARLSVTVSAPLDAAQGNLTSDLTGGSVGAADVEGLLDRIAARLGEDSVAVIAPRASHIPERAETLAPRDTVPRDASNGTAPTFATAERPLRLFARPEPILVTAGVPDGPPMNFRWRRAAYRVTRAEGPERIAAEWWHAAGATRDYYRVEDETGHRFWLYRDGLYVTETTTPQWYMHGIFG
jgi:protein ImuB